MATESFPGVVYKLVDHKGTVMEVGSTRDTSKVFVYYMDLVVLKKFKYITLPELRQHEALYHWKLKPRDGPLAEETRALVTQNQELPGKVTCTCGKDVSLKTLATHVITKKHFINIFRKLKMIPKYPESRVECLCGKRVQFKRLEGHRSNYHEDA